MRVSHVSRALFVLLQRQSLTCIKEEGDDNHFPCDTLIGIATRPQLSNIVIVIVIVNSIFLQRPQRRSRWNQLIRTRLSKTNSIGSGLDPESQAGRESDGYGGRCLKLSRGE